MPNRKLFIATSPTGRIRVRAGLAINRRESMPFPARDFRALLPQSGPRVLRQTGDRTFSFRRAGGFPTVSARGALLIIQWRSLVWPSARHVLLREYVPFLPGQIRPPGLKETFLPSRLHEPVRVSLVLA